MKDGYKLVFLPDMHLITIPTTRGWKPWASKAMWAALNFCKYFRPDETIIGGDFIDFNYIKKHDPQNRLIREKFRLVHDFAFGNQILDIVDKFTKQKKVFIMGNHDQRLATYVAEHPELKGLVSLSYSLKLEKRQYEIVEENKAYKVGHARFIHGWYYNLHHAKKTVTEMGDNVFYGHVHDVQAFTKVNYENKPIMGHSVGTLGDLDPEWRKGRPNRWVNGFGVFYFSSNGNFTFYNPIVIEGKFWWNGKLFGGNK